MSFVEEMADNIVFLLEGKIYFDGSPEQLLKDHGEIKLERAIANILRPHVE
jgi:Cu-processing system ATP-binding protein